MLRALLVDDEQNNLDNLEFMLKHDCEGVMVVGKAHNAVEAREWLSKNTIDILFLDINMPGETGFDLLKSLPNHNFKVIFVTAYSEYSLQAIKASAVDYLLKPYGISDLTSALHKFETKKELKQSLNHIQTLLHNVNNNTSGLTKIALPTMKGFVFVVINTIIRCEADNVYTTIYFTDNSTVVISRSIKECEQLLSHYNFFRAHNSHLINMQHVKEYIKGDGGTIKMADGSTVDLSRLRKEDFIEKLNRI